MEQARTQAGSEAAKRDLGGNEIAEPSDDEFIPTVSNDVLLANAPSPVLDPTWNQVGNPFNPKRENQAAPSDVPDLQMPETGGPAESDSEDLSFTQRHTIRSPGAQLVVTVTKDQQRKAGEYPTRGRPSYEALYPLGEPTLDARDPICLGNLAGSGCETRMGTRGPDGAPHIGPHGSWRVARGRWGFSRPECPFRVASPPCRQGISGLVDPGTKGARRKTEP